MAFYVKLGPDKRTGSSGGNTTWQLGTLVRQMDPVLESFDAYADRVLYLEADGKELEYIKGLFPNIPIPRDKKTARWYGDIARTILFSL